MSTSRTPRNERAREKARAAGQDKYVIEVVEMWVGCVACGSVIRFNIELPGRRGLWRRCRCRDLAWRFTMDGWMREVMDPPFPPGPPWGES